MGLKIFFVVLITGYFLTMSPKVEFGDKKPLAVYQNSYREPVIGVGSLSF